MITCFFKKKVKEESLPQYSPSKRVGKKVLKMADLFQPSEAKFPRVFLRLILSKALVFESLNKLVINSAVNIYANMCVKIVVIAVIFPCNDRTSVMGALRKQNINTRNLSTKISRLIFLQMNSVSAS